ncbi:MAG: Ig-like domain-containing protein [Myxococcales bacterium]|nr:Ig-like domain-containing protein [Myxococcales bacterium]
MIRLLVGAGLAVLSSCGPTSMPMPMPVRTPDAANSTLEVSKTTAVADNSDTIELIVTVKDSTGAPVNEAGVVVAASGRGTPVDASGRTSTGSDGKLTLALRSNVAETRTITATVTTPSGPVALSMQPVVTFLAGPLANVRFTVQPSQVRVGLPITPAVALAAEDAHGNLVASSDVTVSVRLVRTTMAGGLSGGAAKRVSDGGVVFDALTIANAESGVALRAETSNGSAAESMTFTVVP